MSNERIDRLFGDTLGPGAKQAYALMLDDPLTWGKACFPRHFRDGSPDFHFSLMDSAMQYQELSIAAPRGSAKSTLLVFLYPFHCLMFKQRRFILIVSNTFKKASMHLETIKAELRENETLKTVFPQVKIIKDAEGDSEFCHPDGFKVKILCKGVDQIGSIRGVKFGADRPDLIIGDDIEDDELVRNPSRRRELQDMYDEALIPAGQHKKTQIIMIGTVLHDDCQLAKLVSPNYYPEYHKVIMQAHLDVGKETERSLWPERWSLADLRHLMEEKPSVYAKEMQNDPVAGHMQKFRKEDFRYWKQEGTRYALYDEEGKITSSGNLSDCIAAISCDLAWDEKRQHDFSVILPGFLTPSSDILVSDYICKKGLRPHEIEEIIFSMETRLKALTNSTVFIGFEKAKLEKVIKHLLKQAMKQRNHFLVFKDLVWDGDKQQRIETRLEPRYAQHVMYHKQGMGELEYQLERFPSGAHEDLPDALQGLCQILQYPKNTRPDGSNTDDDMFERLRNLSKQQKEGGRFKGFGKRTGVRGIPAIRSLW